jgi:S-DNA-T family DNA segregation ATPase FtsK/SpoIIIE
LALHSRPRTAAEFFTLVLATLAASTFAALTVSGVVNGRAPGAELAWTSLLIVGAILTRTHRHWHGELRTMTRARLQTYIGSALLVTAATSVSWRFLAESAGWGSAYLFLGPASGPALAPVVLICAVLVSFALIFGFPVGGWLLACFFAFRAFATGVTRQNLVRTGTVGDPEFESRGEPGEGGGDLAEQWEKARVISLRSKAENAGGETLGPLALVPIAGPPLPPIDTFKAAPKGVSVPIDVEHKARRIEETLASFGVRARVVGHHAGPVVTQFDVQPESGVKVKSIVALQNDLALALAAPTIRIQAPVPGKPVVGIEIPNSAASVVALRELLESDIFRSSTSSLGVMLGKDVAGGAAAIDLAKMPHLLIAGATGSGKSVCVNAIISCLLYRNTPEQVRLMMIDPKMVELTVYNGVPHLLSPVVTQMDKVVGVLQWSLREMERRYQLFADNTVRNIQRYNEKMDQASINRLPYIVIIVDELADLMMVSPEEVEESICRLAQLARAAGIHLVIATQRPSVDVVTGLIKANFPARIAFMMTSQVDSRTILDRAGAEKLLGGGDMLYQPPDGPAPVRLQGAYVSDQEIERLVEFWKRSPLQSAVAPVPPEEFAAAEKAAGDADDELLQEAITVVRKFRTASVTLLQRHLRIGYARAARVMDQLEEHGVVGPPDGSKQRRVLEQESP